MSAAGNPDAIRRCREIISRHSRSFALASQVFPPLCRDRAAVIYTWCRYADDAIDRAPRHAQPRALAHLCTQLAELYQGREQTDITLEAFRQVIGICQIPREYPAELLAGMEMDVVGTDYSTMDLLLLYCFRVAGTVGLMMSHVMGVASGRDDALDHATHMGIGMQLTNICRDVLEDWDMGRLYIPDELLAEHGAAGLRGELGRPFPRTAVVPMAGAVRALLYEAERYYRSGDRGLAALPWRCALAVRAARLIYSSIGDRVRRQGCDVSAGRAVVPAFSKLALVGRAGLHAALELPERAREHARSGSRATIPGRVVRFPDGVRLA